MKKGELTLGIILTLAAVGAGAYFITQKLRQTSFVKNALPFLSIEETPIWDAAFNKFSSALLNSSQYKQLLPDTQDKWKQILVLIDEDDDSQKAAVNFAKENKMALDVVISKIFTQLKSGQKVDFTKMG